MKNLVVVGSQWGDEGKGKIVDWLSEQADVVIRFQGGHNAGHTLVIDGVTYKLHRLSQECVQHCDLLEILLPHLLVQIANQQFFLYPHHPIEIQQRQYFSLFKLRF